MRVILLKDIKGFGKKHEVKEVSPGYARNFLIPKKLVEIAAPPAMAKLANDMAMEEAEEKIKQNLLEKNLNDLSEKTIILKENANDLGHLFARIHQEEISDAIKNEFRLDIAAEFIVIDEPIKALGKFNIKVGVGGKETTFTLVVEKKE